MIKQDSRKLAGFIDKLTKAVNKESGGTGYFGKDTYSKMEPLSGIPGNLPSMDNEIRLSGMGD